jgi:hypothetical protein
MTNAANFLKAGPSRKYVLRHCGHDQKQGHGRRRWIKAQQFLGDDHMRRARYRQQFRESLDDSENDYFQK